MGTLLLPNLGLNERMYSMAKDGKKFSNGLRSPGPKTSGHHGGPSRQASAGILRSPGDLPMPITFHQSRESMRTRRSTRSLEKNSVGKVEKASIQQCRQNKLLFEEAVDRAESTVNLNHSDLVSPTLTSNFSYIQQKGPSFQKSSLPSSYSNRSNYSSLPTLNDLSSYSQGDKFLPDYARPSNCSIKSKTNGPTVIGSPLYNKRGSVSGEDRSSEAVSTRITYNHERYRTAPPAIKKYMKDVSSSYKVVVPWIDPGEQPSHHILRNPLYKDHIYLIPQDEDYPFGFQHDYPNGILTSTLLEEAPNQRIQNWTNGEDKFERPSPDLRAEKLCDEKPLSSVSDNESGKGADNGVKGGSGVPKDLAQAGDNDSGKVIGQRTPEKTSVGNPQPVISRSNIGQGNPEKEKADGEESNDSSSLPSKPSSAHYWKKKTWVDDVTVTSSKKSDDVIEAGGEEVQPEKPSPSKAVPVSPRKNNTDKSKPDQKPPAKTKPEFSQLLNSKTEGTLKDQKVCCANEHNENQVTATPVEVPQEKVIVLNLNDLKKRRTSLPNFICPSSETKSREAAVRDWLETTSIHWAVKTAPLL